MGRMALRKRLAADLAAALTFNLVAMTVAWSGDRQQILFLVVLFMITSLMWIPLMRRFGFLTILVVWAHQMSIQGAPLKATGWVAHQTIVLHLIPIAVAAWAVWVIVSAENRTGMESAGA